MYTLRFAGKTGVGQIFTITAKDNDEGENARVQFRILDGNNMGSFLLTEKGKNQVGQTSLNYQKLITLVLTV